MDDPRFGVPQIAARARLPNDEVKRVFDVLLTFLEEGHPVTVYGFGQFDVVENRLGHPVINFTMSHSVRVAWKKRREQERSR